MFEFKMNLSIRQLMIRNNYFNPLWQKEATDNRQRGNNANLEEIFKKFSTMLVGMTSLNSLTKNWGQNLTNWEGVFLRRRMAESPIFGF